MPYSSCAAAASAAAGASDNCCSTVIQKSTTYLKLALHIRLFRVADTTGLSECTASLRLIQEPSRKALDSQFASFIPDLDFQFTESQQVVTEEDMIKVYDAYPYKTLKLTAFLQSM